MPHDSIETVGEIKHAFTAWHQSARNEPVGLHSRDYVVQKLREIPEVVDAVRMIENFSEASSLRAQVKVARARSRLEAASICAEARVTRARAQTVSASAQLEKATIKYRRAMLNFCLSNTPRVLEMVEKAEAALCEARKAHGRELLQRFRAERGIVS